MELECPHADAIKVCTDALPNACPLQRRIGHVWFALLILPLGVHHVRYLARFGSRTVCVGQECINVTQAEPTNA